MKLKLRPTDFRVRELLRDDFVTESGEFVVYRVTKRKLTSPEAAGILANAAGVDAADISMAGLKDRQGVTIQYMTAPGGRRVHIADPDLRIEAVGRSAQALESSDSNGNAFDIAVRGLTGRDLTVLRKNLELVRRVGVPNYFDDQRFGNLRYHQGWVARDLIAGRAEDALRRLITARSDFEQAHDARFKSGLEERWGDWDQCLALSRKRGQHRSLFEHLVERPNDFAGAFRYVATRIRLIHLFAWQSHLFNRALAERVRRATGVDDRVVLSSIEGPLVCPGEAWPEAVGATLLLPGPGLQQTQDADEFDLFRDVLAEEGIAPGDHRIEGVEGFALKAERRDARVLPQHLRVRPAEPDRENPGSKMVRVRFELPRGAYASLMVKRLLADGSGRSGHEHRRPRTLSAGGFEGGGRDHHGERRGHGGHGGHGARRDGGGHRGRRDDGHWSSRETHDGPFGRDARQRDRRRGRDERDGGFGGGQRDGAHRGGGYRSDGRSDGRRDDRRDGGHGGDRGGRSDGRRDERGSGRDARNDRRDDRRGGQRDGGGPHHGRGGYRPGGNERRDGGRPFGQRPGGDRPGGDRGRERRDDDRGHGRREDRGFGRRPDPAYEGGGGRGGRGGSGSRGGGRPGGGGSRDDRGGRSQGGGWRRDERGHGRRDDRDDRGDRSQREDRGRGDDRRGRDDDTRRRDDGPRRDDDR